MNRTSFSRTVLPVGSALVLAAATLWTVLVEARVTVTAPPEWEPGTDFGIFLEDYYAWQATTLAQERGALALLCVGLAGVVVAAVRIARTGGTARAAASIGVGTGAAAWAFVSLGQAGARHAVEQMAASGNQIDAVNSIAFTVDATTNWLHAGACLALGAGMLVLTRASTALLWRVACVTTSAAALVVAALLLGSSDAATYAALALGGVLLPVWVVSAWRTAHGVTDGAPAGSPTTGEPARPPHDSVPMH